MNTLVEKGYITEMVCGANFAYVLRDNAQFLSTEYKVFHSQGEGRFIRCMKQLYNGKIQFYYLTTGYKSLESLLPVINPQTFVTIVTNLVENIIEIRNNGFLSCQNVDISFARIYVDPLTYQVRLIYLPIKRRFFEDGLSFESELRTSLVKTIAGNPNLAAPETMQLSADLSNGILTLGDLYNRIKDGIHVSPNFMQMQQAMPQQNIPPNIQQNIQPGMQTSGQLNVDPMTGQPVNAPMGILQLVTLNAPTRIILDITKDEFVIGKNGAVVDGVLTFNKAISRVHCKIVRQGGQYAIVDLQSANGTYVNGVRLQPNQASPLNNGDIVRLANSDFQAVMS